MNPEITEAVLVVKWNDFKENAESWLLKYIVCNEGTVLELEEWDKLSPEEKRVQLYLKQKKMLEDFLEHGAISQAQFDKSFGDLTEKMGMQEYENHID